MKKQYFPLSLGLLTVLIGGVLFAGQPELNVRPTLPTTLDIPKDGTVLAQYKVTNHLQHTATWAMHPEVGIEQVIMGVNNCSSLIKLRPKQSCLLTLQVAADYSKAHKKGPWLCKVNNNPPDDSPECERPSLKNRLVVHLAPVSKKASLSVTPTPQILPLTLPDDTKALSANLVQTLILIAASGIPGFLTVFNKSTRVTALNIHATLPWGDVQQDASDCLRLEPRNTCQLQFIAGNTLYSATPVPISGTNTTQTVVTIEVISLGMAAISASPLFLLTPNADAPKIITVTNLSTTVTALNIAPRLTDITDLAHITVRNNTCGTVLPGEICELEFEYDGLYSAPFAVPFSIFGDNTTVINAAI